MTQTDLYVKWSINTLHMGLSHALRSLQALSVGDAYGENIMKILPACYEHNRPWTDDTAMAITVVRMLAEEGKIDQGKLAVYFAERYHADPNRGYGRGTANLLYAIRLKPEEWLDLATNWWGPGVGSHGNGAAMRVAPLGAFYSNLHDVAEQARLQAQVTHNHPEAIAGAVAVAVAASIATHSHFTWAKVMEFTPDSAVRAKLDEVSRISTSNHENIARNFGNGSQVSALDTVPFCLWAAKDALLFSNFGNAMKQIESVGGDTDTNCAIVAGIIGNVVPPPDDWIAATEKYN